MVIGVVVVGWLVLVLVLTLLPAACCNFQPFRSGLLRSVLLRSVQLHFAPSCSRGRAQVSSLSLPLAKLVAVYEQLVLELLEMRELDVAR